MNVSGHFLPTLFIFPLKRMNKNGRLMVGAPPEFHVHMKADGLIVT